MKRNGKPKLRIRILGILLGCILLAGDLLSAVQPVYATAYGGYINKGQKTYTYASHVKDAFSFSIGEGNVTVESVPQEFLSKSQGINVAVSKTGRWENGWENNQFVFEHENKDRYRQDIVSFPHKIPLPEDDGVYTLAVHVKLPDEYESFNLAFTVAGSDAFFRKPWKYEDNEKIFKKRYRSKTALWAFTRPYYKAGSKEDQLIKKTAEAIVNKGDSDYEKIRKVHDWVANNVWYDYDYFKTDKTDTDPVKVLESKKTICGGYAQLTEALLHALGIPTRYISGKVGNAAHAWNEAYADGRWIILDTTWDSWNKYKDGTFLEAKPCSIVNFDMTLEEFSATHTIGYDDNGYYQVYYTVSESLSISQKNLALKKGKTKQISVKASEKGIDFKDLSITYSSSNKKVATVSKNGKITGKKAGTAIIKTKIKMKELGKETIITFETKVTVKK